MSKCCGILQTGHEIAYNKLLRGIKDICLKCGHACHINELQYTLKIDSGESPIYTSEKLNDKPDRIGQIIIVNQYCYKIINCFYECTGNYRLIDDNDTYIYCTTNAADYNEYNSDRNTIQLENSVNFSICDKNKKYEYRLIYILELNENVKCHCFKCLKKEGLSGMCFDVGNRRKICFQCGHSCHAYYRCDSSHGNIFNIEVNCCCKKCICFQCVSTEFPDDQYCSCFDIYSNEERTINTIAKHMIIYDNDYAKSYIMHFINM